MQNGKTAEMHIDFTPQLYNILNFARTQKTNIIKAIIIILLFESLMIFIYHVYYYIR